MCDGGGRLRAGAVGALVAALAAGGCGGGGGNGSKPSDADQVTKAVRTFAVATADGDAAGACDLLVPAAQRRLIAIAARATSGAASSCQDAVGLVRVAAPPALLRALRDVRVQRVVVRGDRASAVAADGRQFPSQRVVLRRDGGTWRIADVPTLLRTLG